MMKHRRFFDNSSGISLMYDAILFIVMVSLAGAIFLPLLQTPIALESSVDKHRENVVDTALHTFLVSRADLFSYRFCGVSIDDIAQHIGINVSSDGLYASFTEWLLAHEQRHKTYATLLAENLGCQFRLPFSFFGMNRLNIVTEEYDRILQEEIDRFFCRFFGEKYCYNFTAWWHPIKGVPFGGELSVGLRPPTKDCYVAQSILMMPYTPVFSFQNHTIVFTKRWIQEHLFSIDGVFGNSSIPEIENLTCIFENYTKRISPFDTKENATRAMQENLSVLVYGFLIDGISDDTNVSVFPGVIHMSLVYGFEKIQNITTNILNNALDELFGGVVRTIDRLFDGLNTSVAHPVSTTILDQINVTMHSVTNMSFVSLNEAFNACEAFLKEQITSLISDYLDELLKSFVNSLIDMQNTLVVFFEMIIDFLLDQICLNKAEVMLTIWVVRE